MNEITNANVKEVISVLNRAFTEFGIDFYLIGAKARDYWFDANKIPIIRGTYDIDFAVLVPDIQHFENLKIKLKENFFPPQGLTC
jgi:predicted nucleotidyltransferase